MNLDESLKQPEVTYADLCAIPSREFSSNIIGFYALTFIVDIFVSVLLWKYVPDKSFYRLVLMIFYREFHRTLFYKNYFIRTMRFENASIK